MVTKPRRGSLIRRSSISATMTWIRSAILRTRGLLMVPSYSWTPDGAVPDRGLRRLTVAWRRSAAGDLPHLERLDDVALLDVLEVAQDQTALEALADLGGVVLLALQRGQVEVVGHDRAAADHAAGDHATGDVADLGRAEDRADLRLPQGRLLELRLEHALEGRLDLVDRLVDDRVVPDLDTLAVRQLRRLALRADVEADDDRVGSS